MPQERNPLLDPNYFGGSSQQRQNPLLNPSYFGGASEPEEEDELSTAIGRKRSELTNIAQNKERLKSIRARATTEQQRQRIDRILAEMDEDTRPRGPVRSHPLVKGAEEFGRGALAGVANAIPSAIDLALTPPDLAGLDAAESARRKLQESQQLVRETVDSKGALGTAGEITGGIAGAAIPYGMAASATGRVASKLIPGLAKQIAAGKMSPALAKRVIANVGENVIGGSIINALQAMGLPDADIKEKLKTFGIGIGADILFGAAQGALTPPKAASKAVAPGEKTPAELAKELEAEGKKRLAIKEADSQVRRLAKADWQVRNPTGNWNELTKAQKQEIYEAMRAKLTAEGAIKKEQGPDVGGAGGDVGGAPAPKPPTAPSGPGGSEAPIVDRVPPYEKAKRTPEQLENLRKAGGDDDPIIQDIRKDKSLTEFEKQKAIARYRADVRKMQKEEFGEILPGKEQDKSGVDSELVKRGGIILPKGVTPGQVNKELDLLTSHGADEATLRNHLKEKYGFSDQAASNFLKHYKPKKSVPNAEQGERRQSMPRSDAEWQAWWDRMNPDQRFGRWQAIDPTVKPDEKEFLGSKSWYDLSPEDREALKQSWAPPEQRPGSMPWKYGREWFLDPQSSYTMKHDLLRDLGFEKNEAARIINEGDFDSLPAAAKRMIDDFYQAFNEGRGREWYLENLPDKAPKNFNEIERKLNEEASRDVEGSGLFTRPEGGFYTIDPNLKADWDGLVDDAARFPNSAAKRELDSIAKELGITPARFNDMSPADRAKVYDWLETQSDPRDLEPKDKGVAGKRFERMEGRMEPPLKAKGAPSVDQWWPSTDRNFRGSIWNEFFMDAREDPDAMERIDQWVEDTFGSREVTGQDIVDLSPNELLPEFRDYLNKRLLDMYGEPEVDVGRTVFEPDARRRAELARPTVPEDVKDSFTDLIIDAVQQGSDEATFVRNLIKFARENELPDEAVFNTLEDSTGWVVKDGQLVGSPLEGPPGATAPESSPSVPAPLSPASELPTPPPTKGKIVPGAIAASDLSTLDSKAIDKLKDKVFDALDADPDNPALLADMEALAAATRRMGRPQEVIPREPVVPEEAPIQEADLPPLPEAIPPEIAAEIQAEASQNLSQEIPFAGQVRPDYVQDQVIQGPPRVEETPLMDPLEYSKLARSSPRKLDDAKLQQMIDETDLRMRMNPDSPEYKVLMEKLAAEKVARRPPPPQANMPPAVGGAVLGYAYGLFTGDDENRQSNALMWAMAGAFGGAAIGKLARESKPPKKELFPGQSTLPKVISYEADRSPKTLSPLAAARRWYAGIVRSSAGLESIYAKTNTSSVLPTQQNAARMASIFGRWVAVAERWMTNRPVILGPDGEPVYLDAPSLKAVGDMVGGDIENLDEVAVALTTLENIGKINRLPMDPVRAQMTVANATPDLIQGAKAMRSYALALADAMVDAGILSPEIRDKFAAEQWYTPLQRVFGDGVTKQQIEQLAKMGDVAISPNPVKGRKGGSTMLVKSPFETLQRMTAQYIRAAEYNKIKQQFIAFAKANPQLELLQRVDSKKNPAINTFITQIAAIKKLIPSISNQDAAGLAVALGEDIDPRSPIMTVYEDGTLRSYRIHEPVFDAFKAMLPSEMSTALKLFAVPTQLATRGVVHNPFFITTQFFIDTFQSALMSKYGFRPIIDSVRGWWHAVSRSPEYRRILDLGGPATIQSLPYINPKSSTAAIKAQGTTALETAARQIKELHPIEAYKTLATPIAEAARIGEALRALDHGESTISAVYAAWHATGNTRMQGHFGAIRAFNLLTMFSRPAISAMDEAVTKAGINPFRRPDQSKGAIASGLRQLGFTNDRVINGAEFLTKGFALIGLPSMYLWFHNLGDEELDQLRQTESGQRYWFFRGPEAKEGPGQIYKVRKPHVLGQLFGSTLESTLDQMYQRDPENTLRWVGGIVNDAALNVLPQFGVVPAALWGNKIPGLDIPIVPESDLKLEPQLMGAPQASNPARIVADKLAPISNAIPQEAETLRRALSPAGLDYIFGTIAGMLGQDAVSAADVAINYYDSGIAPAKYELPIVGRLFGRYPQMNTRSVRDFYKKAERVETVALSFAELLKSNPEAAIQYLQDHQMEISLAQAFQSTRQTVANMLRAVEDMKNMLRNRQITQSEFRRVEEEMLRQIITQTGLANSIANQIMMESP